MQPQKFWNTTIMESLLASAEKATAENTLVFLQEQLSELLHRRVSAFHVIKEFISHDEEKTSPYPTSSSSGLGSSNLNADALCKGLLAALNNFPDFSDKVAEVFATLAREGEWRDYVESFCLE